MSTSSQRRVLPHLTDDSDVALRDAAHGDMIYRNDVGLWVPVAGTKTDGNVPTIQADGSVAWDATGGGGGTDVLHTAISDTPIDIADTNPVTIVTANVGVAVGDILVARLWGNLLNQSGTDRTYTFTPDFNAAFVPSGTQSHGGSGNPRNWYLEWVLGVIDASSAVYRGILLAANNPSAAGEWGATTNNNQSSFDTAASDVTGNIAVDLQIASNSVSDTQQFTPFQFVIQRFRSP